MLHVNLGGGKVFMAQVPLHIDGIDALLEQHLPGGVSQAVRGDTCRLQPGLHQVLPGVLTNLPGGEPREQSLNTRIAPAVLLDK